jgi:diguanylate cyclase (GGDEF)-like protein
MGSPATARANGQRIDGSLTAAWLLAHAPAGRRTLTALTCAALAAVCLIVGSVIVDARRDAGRAAALGASNLAAAVAHEVDRNIEITDLSIQSVTQAWPKPDVQALAPALRDMVLFGKLGDAAGLGTILVLDERGVLQASSRPLASKITFLGDREYFRVHLGSQVGLFVSKPFISRFSGRWQIGLSRRIDKADGSFGGVVVGTIEIAYLNKLYEALDLGKDGSITLFRTDGTVITRAPFAPDDVRRFLGGTNGFSAIRQEKSGSIEGPSPMGDGERIISFHRVGNLPLIQDVEVSADESYAGWRRKSLILVAALALTCFSSLALLLLLNAELVRRGEMEATLRRLATTDALTDLPNRRWFVEALDTEWTAAQRNGGDLSLLMIDADRFKPYNDLLGHPAGDELLKAFAGCLRGLGALACRYGGEEFAVLLPRAGAAEALAVAEKVRLATLRLARPHPGSPERVATISIGVASLRSGCYTSSEQLVAAADLALYRAKSDGRNCCRAAAQTGEPEHRVAA